MGKSPTTYAFLAAFKHFFSRSGWSNKELSYRAEISKSTVTELLQGKFGRKPNYQEKVAGAFGFELIDFLNEGRRILDEGPHRASAAEETQGVDDLGEYRRVPLYESGRLAAGANGLSFDPYEHPAGEVVVYRPELRHRSRHDLRAVRVGGDSMDPVIPAGSIVIVDLNDREFSPGKVFVIARDDGGVEMFAAVKRVHKADRAFVILSENRSYPPEVVEAEWRDLCVGRVVWMWRNLEDA